MGKTDFIAGSKFWEHGYVVADDVVGAGDRSFIKAGMDASRRTGRMRPSGRRAQGAIGEYSPMAAEAFLLSCCPVIEKIVGRELTPTYAFWRIYTRDTHLVAHTDRGACEISASVPIFGEPADMPWPIHVRDLHGQARELALLPGQAVVYQGCRVPHWREPFLGDAQYQLLLHYVVTGGDQAAHAFDRREQMEIQSVRGE